MNGTFPGYCKSLTRCYSHRHHGTAQNKTLECGLKGQVNLISIFDRIHTLR